MRCIVCKGIMNNFFQKQYGEMIHEFVRCSNCGIVINMTVYEMSEEAWARENDYHKNTQGEVDNRNEKWKKRLERLESQAQLVASLYKNGMFVTNNRAVDWGGGDGLFSKLVKKYLVEDNTEEIQDYAVKTFEKYLRTNEQNLYLEESDLSNGEFDLVISSAVLEHLRGKEEIDSFFKLVKEDGVVVFHTLVCEEVPNDPSWFYINKPVHCTIWTNKSMEYVYNSYGFKGCAYHLPSKMWLLFKDEAKYKKLIDIHDKIDGKWIFEEKFVDYWKQPPYHTNEERPK